MKRLPLRRRTLALIAVLVPLMALFVYTALRSGPLAPIPVTVETVQEAALSPSLFGIGTVDARYRYRIGPTFAGRLQRVDVDVGETVKAGQRLGEMAPIDFDDRVAAQTAAIGRAQAAVREADARHVFARTQADRYRQLLKSRTVSAELAEAKRQELAIAVAARSAALRELERIRSEQAGAVAQRDNLRLIAPVDGLVIGREADPGTTVVAGQTVVEMIDPHSIWIEARFDQISAIGLEAGLPATIVLRSRPDQPLSGRVLRVEPRADAITEEMLARVVFDALPEHLPPLGELVEVTVDLAALPALPVIANAAIQHVDGRLGVWRLESGEPVFVPVRLGAADLDGRVQVLSGLAAGDRVVVYSNRSLRTGARIRVVDSIAEPLR